MRKVIFITSIAIIFCISSLSYADTPLKKLGRGVANIVSCPMEIINRVHLANEESGPLAGYTWGLLDGIYRTGLRALTGAYEVISFPFPLPKDYKPIITDPEFFFEEGVW